MLVFPSLLSAQSSSSSDDEVLARIGDDPITSAQVRSRVERELQDLKMERLRFQAEQREKEHQILQNGLEEMVQEDLLAREARARGVSEEELLAAEVDSQVSEPSEEEVEQFYEVNKERIRTSKEQVLPQIRQYLVQQRRQLALEAFLDQLKDKYPVQILLEPLRFDVAAEGYPSLGPADAPVTIVEFSDFECPYCSRLAATLKQVREQYPEQVRIVFRHFPLRSIHPNAQKAAEASLCAEDQGKFWEMHDRLFEQQQSLANETFLATARELNLDLEAFQQCLQSGRYAQEVQSDFLAGARTGISGTPSLFINGRKLVGAVSYEEIVQVIEEELGR